MYPTVARGWIGGLSTPERNLFVAVVVLFLGIAVGALAATLVRRLLVALGVDDAVEGTSFERTARQLGGSTVQFLSRLVGAFVFFLAALYSIRTVGLVPGEALIEEAVAFLPRLFVAVSSGRLSSFSRRYTRFGRSDWCRARR